MITKALQSQLKCKQMQMDFFNFSIVYYYHILLIIIMLALHNLFETISILATDIAKQ